MTTATLFAPWGRRGRSLRVAGRNAGASGRVLSRRFLGAAFLAILASGLGCTSSPPADRVAWHTIAGAETAARAAGKPLLYDFTAEWCPPCQEMKREVFAHRGSAEAIGQMFIPVQVMDRSREEGQNPPAVTALQKRYEVVAFPTLVIVAPGSGEPVVLEGFGGREALMQSLAEAAMKAGIAMRDLPR